MAQNMITDPMVMLLALIGEAAKTSVEYHSTEIEAACRGALKGKTPNEPLPSDAIAQIALRGFCIHNGTVWGLVKNISRGRLELVRLTEIRQGSNGQVILGSDKYEEY